MNRPSILLQKKNTIFRAAIRDNIEITSCCWIVESKLTCRRWPRLPMAGLVTTSSTSTSSARRDGQSIRPRHLLASWKSSGESRTIPPHVDESATMLSVVAGRTSSKVGPGGADVALHAHRWTRGGDPFACQGTRGWTHLYGGRDPRLSTDSPWGSVSRDERRKVAVIRAARRLRNCVEEAGYRGPKSEGALEGGAVV